MLSVNLATRGLSTPAVTMVSSTWASKAEWTGGEDLGSDHLPIAKTFVLQSATLIGLPSTKSTTLIVNHSIQLPLPDSEVLPLWTYTACRNGVKW